MLSKLTFCFLYSFLFISSFFSLSAAENMAAGELRHGFKLKEKRFIKEVGAECLFFEHVKSGARLFKIAADDSNKTFAVIFNTLPENDCGTPHILEHSVLDGSKKFPVKSPFDVLSKGGSMKTFLNAMTMPLATVYPVASMNEQDYFNLMDVYLDAVFHPRLLDDERILKREGWHYELTDKDAPLMIRGIVYNEMKGGFSNPQSLLYYLSSKNLFSGTSLGVSSGGHPDAIPQLSYDYIKNFHKKFYTPSNSFIFLYGDADLDRELKFIDAGYLSHYDKNSFSAPIPYNKTLGGIKKISGNYPVPGASDMKKKTYISMTFLTGPSKDTKLSWALDLIADALVNQEAAPLRKALRDAGMTDKVNAYAHSSGPYNIFGIQAQSCSEGDAEKLQEIAMDVFRSAAEKGIDKVTLEGILNRIEFSFRERANSAQKGLTCLFGILRDYSWVDENNPFKALEYEKTLAEIRKAVKEGYLQTVIFQYLLQKPVGVLVELNPKPGLEKENDAKLAEKLAAYKTSLSNAQLDALVKETNELIEYQKMEDSPEALAAVPSLKLKDISRKAQWEDISATENSGVPYLSYLDNCSGVIYAKLFFGAEVLPRELLPYAVLLSRVLGKASTDKTDFQELEKLINLHTGGFSSGFSIFQERHDDSKMFVKFALRSKCLRGKSAEMFSLIEEIIDRTNYSDKERLKTIISRHYADLMASASGEGGMSYASIRLFADDFRQGVFEEITGGLEYYWFIKNLYENFDTKADEISANLRKTAALLFSKNTLTATSVCDKDNKAEFEKSLVSFTGKLRTENHPAQNWKLTPFGKNEALLGAVKVQYVMEGGNFKEAGFSWNGKMHVLNRIVSKNWIWNRIRVLGGAYGGWFSSSPNGRLVFSSYRDPNLKETLDVYNKTPEFLKDFKQTQDELDKVIIGVISGMDTPKDPNSKGGRAFSRYLSKITKDEVQKERDEIFTCTPADIRNMSKLLKDTLAKSSICVYGNEDKLKAEKGLFNELINLDGKKQP